LLYVLQEQQKHLETCTQLELYRSRLAAAEQQMAGLQGRAQQAAAACELLNSVRAQVSVQANGIVAQWAGSWCHVIVNTRCVAHGLPP
jgi:hypothetical protein